MSRPSQFSDITTIFGLAYLQDKLQLAYLVREKADALRAQIDDEELERREEVQRVKRDVKAYIDAWTPSAQTQDEIIVPPTRRYVPAAGVIGRPRRVSDASSASSFLLDILHSRASLADLPVLLRRDSQTSVGTTSTSTRSTSTSTSASSSDSCIWF